jgi:hypothetical protein
MKKHFVAKAQFINNLHCPGLKAGAIDNQSIALLQP